MAFTLPGDLGPIGDEALASLVDEALDALRALNLSQDSDDESITKGEELAEAIKQIRALQTTRVTERTQRQERTAKALEALDEPAPEPPPEPEAQAPEVVEEPAPEPVLASAKPSPVVKAAAVAPAIRTETTQVTITAAADVPGYSNGQRMDGGMQEIGMAALTRMQGMPTFATGDNVRHRYGVAVIRRDGYGELTQDHYKGDDSALVNAAGNAKRLPGGSLTAAGGWCAPSETLYDICSGTTVEGILSLPEFAVSRGGIRYTPQPDFAAIYGACGFQQTEAQAIAGTCKTCCEPTCPAFQEVRLDLIGLCIKAPLLTKVAYPEWISYFTGEAMNGFAHKVNQYVIAKMVAAAGTAITAPYNDQKSISLTLNALDWQAIAMRQKWRLGLNRTIEVILPHWFRSVVRMDLSYRNCQDWGTVTDSQIASWFSARNLSPQYVYDWQDLTITGKVPNFPTTVDVLMYPDGTWQRGTASVINVDAVYDSVGLESNMFTALFMEEGILVVQRCLETHLVTLPICVSGRTAANDLTACFPAAQA